MEKKKITLSVAIAVYNEQKTLDACLSSVTAIADEIVLVDGGSTDKTLSIAEKYTTTIIKTTNPPIFHINKQKALDRCQGTWILQIDADEVIPEELRKEISGVVTGNSGDINGYYIPRRNYFWGHFMKKGGQYPDEVIRLMKNGKGTFPCKSVHEQIIISGSVGHLKNPMLHYSYRTREDYWKKADTYTSLTALELSKRNENRFLLCLQYCIAKPIATFFSLFIRHKGFVDGVTGFEFSLYSALHFPIAYRKYLSQI
jgi:glycosyltransferase involved in cell wall biosynthesis